MSNQTLQQDQQDFLDPENKETLVRFLKEHNLNLSDEAVDIVNRMTPLRVKEKVFGNDSISDSAKNFFKKIEATNNGAKPGENFEDFLWRYIESDDVPAIDEEELEGLAEAYEKVFKNEPQKQTDGLGEDFQAENFSKEQATTDSPGTNGIKLQVKSHSDEVLQEQAEEKSPLATTANVGQESQQDTKQIIKDAQLDLIKELGIDKLPAEEQEKRITQMGEIIQQRILVRIVEEFPEGQKDELLKLTENKETTPQQFNEFVERYLPNVQEIILDEVGAYKRESLDFVKQVLGEK